MNTNHFILPLLLAPWLAGGATLKVGPGEAYAHIQDAVDAAATGDTIEVAPGLYAENVVIGKSPLFLSGARAGVDARHRVSGSPDPVVESIIAPSSGAALALNSADGPVTVSGFSFSAVPAFPSGTVTAATADLAGFTFICNRVQVLTGANGAALSLNSNAIDATIEHNSFVASAATLEAVHLDGSHAFHGLHFSDNDVLRGGTIGHSGLSVDGNRNVGPSANRPPLIQSNLFQGHAIGFDGGSRSLQAAAISGNMFAGNETGLSAGPKSSVFSANAFNGNSRTGLRLTSAGNTSDASRGATGNTIQENVFVGNGSVPDAGGYGDLVLDQQAPGTQATNLVRRNRFGSQYGLFDNASGDTVDVSSNYWGTLDGPGGSQPGTGSRIAGSGRVIAQPWFTNSSLTTLSFGSTPLSGNLALGNGESITGTSLALAPGATLAVNEGAAVTVGSLVVPGTATIKVDRGSLQGGKMTLEAGSILDVVDGQLSFDPLGVGQFHTLAGSFTFFNCLGSLNINGNTSFSGTTLGLASDIHVANGVTLLVLGGLTLDGCSLDSPGGFSLLVDTGATLKMARCQVSGAAVTLVGGEVTLFDNDFSDSSILAFSSLSGARIYHNVFENGTAAMTLLPGAGVTTTVEGWSNVASSDDVVNELGLSLQPPVNPTRTLDSGGDLYVQPGDPVVIALDLSHLQARTQAVETLLGFSTAHLAAQSLDGTAAWSNTLYREQDETGTIGRFDTAIGLSFTMPDPNGTLQDGSVAKLTMQAKLQEGRTRFFFREKTPADSDVPGTRLTISAGGTPSLLASPFTLNSATITIDGTAPVISPVATAVQVRPSGTVNVLQSGTLCRQGVVTVTFDARDALAGIDDSGVGVTFSGVNGTLHGTLSGTSAVMVGAESFTRYVFDVVIDSSSPNGIFNVDATAMDRSGNPATLAMGAVEILKNRVGASVALQGLTGTPVTRTVVLTATDSSGFPIAVWTVDMPFSGGVGYTLLEEVPDGVAAVSAKTAWNLRTRLAATLDPSGQASLSFTGNATLRGGDINGDNIVNLTDYNLLRSVYLSLDPTADISGDGQTNLSDYNLLRANWLIEGDPP